jgi:hypothetical protein
MPGTAMQSSKRKAVSSEPSVERRLVTNHYSLFTIHCPLEVLYVPEKESDDDRRETFRQPI